jgi:hypothetical protein
MALAFWKEVGEVKKAMQYVKYVRISKRRGAERERSIDRQART